MPTRFVWAGMRFFAVSIVAALVVIALAPLGPIRLLGAVALVCAAAGLALHLYALRGGDPRAFGALSDRLYAMLAQAQAA